MSDKAEAQADWDRIRTTYTGKDYEREMRVWQARWPAYGTCGSCGSVVAADDDRADKVTGNPVV